MTIASYKQGKKFTIIQNTTASSYTMTLEYSAAKMGLSEEQFISFPGTAVILQDVDNIIMDNADYANLLIQTISDVKGFFLVLT